MIAVGDTYAYKEAHPSNEIKSTVGVVRSVPFQSRQSFKLLRLEAIEVRNCC